MSFLEAVISGIVQGITEFLPISSSGHLVILHKLFGIEKPQIVFDIFLHLGTLLAIFIVFWRDILAVFTREKKALFLIVIASLATVLWVLIFNRLIELAFGNSKLVGVMLLVTGTWLILGNFVRYGTASFTGIKAFLIGLAQGIATLPGISRSGATIATGLFMGLEPRKAASFSFLLSIPAVIGAFLFKLNNAALRGIDVHHFFGFLTSCIVGVLSLKLLLKVLYANRLHWFGMYCIVAGIVILIFRI